MVIAIIGESCVGKSTIAAAVREVLHAEVYSGKDYLRFAKNEPDARRAFLELLTTAAESAEQHILYVISEREHLPLVPERALRVVVTASLDTIKTRFAARMRGNLPPPVAAMLERKHGCFDAEPCDVRIVGDETCVADACEMILQKRR